VRTILLIVSIMCRDADGARLVGDRAGDRLPDHHVTRSKLVAAAILDLSTAFIRPMLPS
jgi:hypothetical protein